MFNCGGEILIFFLDLSFDPQANDVNMFRLQFAYYVAPGRFGVARWQWLGRNGSRAGKMHTYLFIYGTELD